MCQYQKVFLESSIKDNNIMIKGTLTVKYVTTILDKLNGTLRPPLPPKSVMGKWRVLAFTHLHPWFGGEGAFLFHFILSKIVYEPQPRSQGFSSLPPNVVMSTTLGGREEKPWERGCMSPCLALPVVYGVITTRNLLSFAHQKLHHPRAHLPFKK